MKQLINFLAISMFLSVMISCSNNDNNPSGSSTTIFKATLTGASETPPNSSAATGNAILTFNNSTKIFTLVVTYSGITPTLAHIHKGAVGVAGDPIFPLTVTASPITYTSIAITSEKEADLNNGLYYVNLHSVDFPQGEIRGQLIKQTSSGGGGGY